MAALTGPIYWVGATSFEDRCRASLEHLREIDLQRVVIWNYGSVAKMPRNLAKARENNLTWMLERARSLQIEVETMAIFPYRLSAAMSRLRELGEQLQVEPAVSVMIDLSCLTKVHAVAVATWLDDNPAFLDRVLLCAATPMQYGWQHGRGRAGGDYREIVFSPVGRFNDAELHHSWRSSVDVIALLGHEGQRLLLALSSLEVTRGLALLSSASQNSDAARMAQIENGQFLRDAADGRIGDWELHTIRGSDLVTAARLVEDRVVRTHESRVVLAPLGPKPLVVQTTLSALSASRGAPRGIWVTYPVPSSYGLDYSIGIGQLTIYCIEPRQP